MGMQQHTMSTGQRQLRIGDLADELKVKKFVIRFWEQEFGLFVERADSNYRFYTIADLQTFQIIKDLLYHQGYTLEGARKKLLIILQEQGLLVAEAAEALADAGSSVDVVMQEPCILVVDPVLEESPISALPLEVSTQQLVPENIAAVSPEKHIEPVALVAIEEAHNSALVEPVQVRALESEREQEESIPVAPVVDHKSHEGGAYVDVQAVVRTCHHEEIAHVPVSVAPCSTCQKHSRHLAMVKDELQELVRRLR